MKKILIYGDSNVWGDNFFTGVRLKDELQWPKILQKKLGNDYEIIQEGLPGRLAGTEETVKTYKNGRYSFMSIFRTASPVDIVIIALGTNDLQLKYQKSGRKIVDDLVWYKNNILEQYADIDDQKKYFVNGKLPRIIYILPTKFDYQGGASGIFDEESEEIRKSLSKLLRNEIDDEILELDYLPLVDDGIHLSSEGHQILADKVKELLKHGK